MEEIKSETKQNKLKHKSRYCSRTLDLFNTCNRMPSTCCVPNCKNRGGFPFPQDSERRKQWISRICREGANRSSWTPNYGDRVCEKHFHPEDIVVKRAVNTDRTWRSLLPSALPIKPTLPTTPRPPSVKDREDRIKRRRLTKVEQNTTLL